MVARWLVASALFAALSLAQGPVGSPPADPPAVQPVEVIEDVHYADRARDPRRNRLDLYLPKRAAASPAVPVALFVHGGGWTGGDKAHGARLARALASQGIACATANMQLYPFATPSVMADDVATALGWVHQHAGEFGLAADQLFLIGHSAGAHLASWAALDGARLRRAGVPREALRGVVGCSGIYDVRARHPLLDGVFGKAPAGRADASPLLHASPLAPPYLVLWAERDLPGCGASARMLVRRFAELGVPARGRQLPGCDHVDYMFQFGAADDRVGPLVVQFLRECLAAERPASTMLRRAAVVEVADPAGPGAGGVRLWVPEGDVAAAWLALATCGAAEQQAAERLAQALVERGMAVAIVAIGEAAAVRHPAALEFLTTRVAQLAATSRDRLPAQRPFVGGFGAGGYLAGVVGRWPGLGDLRVRGRLLLGAPTAAPSLHALLPGLTPAVPLPTAGDAPVLLLVADGDPAPVLGDAAAVIPQLHLADPQHVAVQLPGAGLVIRRELGDREDLVLPLVLAFLGI